jgi:FAD/FMN-containing dehydrogenase
MHEDSLATFENKLRGDVLRPGSDRYEQGRKLWNGLIDKHPALIVRCAQTTDVVETLRFARACDLEVAVRGGGHNVAGLASAAGGLVIDLSEMNDVIVDPVKRVARASGGATIADLDRATQAYGLAAPMGVVSETGIAGLTLSGGVGWLRNKFGLSCDNLVGAEVVTASGEVVQASETEHGDLLWGLKGGGGNFGVVTALECRLHEIGPNVMFAFVIYPRARTEEVLRGFRDYHASAPDEVSALVEHGVVPTAPSFPEALHGEPFTAVAAMYAGAPAQGEKLLKPLGELDEPMLDLSGVMPYLEVQRFFDEDYPDGRLYYWKSTYLSGLSDEVIARLVEHANAAPSKLSTIDLWACGGAMNRVAPGETAFGARQAPYLLAVEANWDDPGQIDANIGWARDVLQDLQRFGGGRYLNFPGFYEDDTVLQEIYGENYQRLVELKRRYDPDNVFRLNQNIRPASTTSISSESHREHRSTE